MKKWFRLLTAASPRDACPEVSCFFYDLPVLETKDLLLRPMRMKDAEDIYAYSSDEEVARYVLWDAHSSLRDTRAFIRYIRRLYREGLPSSWAIEHKASHKVIGSIGFMWVSRENRSAEAGYSLSRAYWNHGYATQALSALLRAGFTDLKLNRIEAQHDVRNPASGRVMEKCGMRREGVLRSRIVNKGEYVDVALWAILRDEFHP